MTVLHPPISAVRPSSAPVLQSPVMMDIAGTQLSAQDRRRLSHPLVGGLILFSRNWENRRQLVDLIAEIKTLRPDVLVAVDHEGGRVQRFRSDGFTHLPAMRVLGERWRRDDRGAGSGALAAVEAATACGYVLAAELRACGVDFSFTPVLDLDWGDSSVIGDRAFDGDPRVVSLLARALMHGLRVAGMSNCGKHFPGHGKVSADSHVAVPVDRRGRRTILDADAQPYGTLGMVLDAVMPAHVIYPHVDTRPAGFSARWLQDILRGEIGFDGCIFSDDLSMQGARQLDGQAISFAQAAVLALTAGCDMVLLCNQSLGNGEGLDALLDGLSEAERLRRWLPDPASEARRVDLLPVAPPLAWDALMVEPRYLRALELVSDLCA